MRHFSNFATIGLLLLGVTTSALGIDTSKINDDAYTMSYLAPPTSVRCVQVLPDFNAEFEPLYSAWVTKNQTQIDAGREAERLKLKSGESLEAKQKRMIGFIEIGLSSFPPEQLKLRCNSLLQQLR